jgi:hypothetical protein
MKSNEFIDMCGLLLLASYDTGSLLKKDHPTVAALAKVRGNDRSHPNHTTVDWMILDSTPTNAALLGLPSIMEEFKRVKQVQIMNLIVLTDGEPSDCLVGVTRHSEEYAKVAGYDPAGYPRRGKIVWRDPKSRKTYDATKSYNNGYSSSSYYNGISQVKQSAILMQIIRDRVGGKTVCIHLATRRDGIKRACGVSNSATINIKKIKEKSVVTVDDSAADKASEAWRKNDWVSIPNAMGFDDYILILCDNLCVEDGGLDEVDLNNKKTAIRDIRRAFTKTMASTKANRPLLTRVAELISK